MNFGAKADSLNAATRSGEGRSPVRITKGQSGNPASIMGAAFRVAVGYAFPAVPRKWGIGRLFSPFSDIRQEYRLIGLLEVGGAGGVA